MPETELITIGEFARSCGLSASALRFYADAEVLVPAVVDESTGYRYYTHDQTDTARLVRHLRAVDMPLPTVAAVLAEPDPTRATRLLDAHLADLDQHLREVRTAATAARAALHAMTADRPVGSTQVRPHAESWPSRPEASSPGTDLAARPNAVGRVPDRDAVAAVPGSSVEVGSAAVVWVSGPLLAAAVDQVATATVTDPQWPVLDTILLEVGDDGLTLTATDRIRLATRTLRPTRSPAVAWTDTVDAVELRSILSWLRRQHSVAIYPGRLHVEFVAAAPVGVEGPTAVGSDDHEPHFAATNSDRRRCHRSTEVFPDYRAMLAALPPARTRVVLARAAFLAALEESGTPVIALRLTPPNTGTLADCPPHRPVPRIDTESPHESIDLAGGSSSATGTGSGHARHTSRDPLPSAPTDRSLPAVIIGPSITIYFAVTALYPAVSSAVGPDVMLDLIAPDLPARIRSADDGDLFTLAMPCRPEPIEEPAR